MSGTAKKPLDTYELVPGVAAGSNTGVVHIGADSGIVKYFQTMHSKDSGPFCCQSLAHKPECEVDNDTLLLVLLTNSQ